MSGLRLFAARGPYPAHSHNKPGTKRGYIEFFSTKKESNELHKFLGAEWSKRTDLDDVDVKQYNITICGDEPFINRVFVDIQFRFPKITRWKLRIMH